MDLKENFARNLVIFRKSLGITQSELAEQLNYSDKAVSKWERAESIPDIYVLKQIADFFGVRVDVLISEPKPEKRKLINVLKRRAFINLASCAIVWLVAIVFYTSLGIIFPSVERSWLSFIYAIPATLIVLLSLKAPWKKSIGKAILTSLLIWSIILTIYLTLMFTLINVPKKLWLIWLIGFPLQCLLIFIFFYKKFSKKQ